MLSIPESEMVKNGYLSAPFDGQHSYPTDSKNHLGIRLLDRSVRAIPLGLRSDVHPPPADTTSELVLGTYDTIPIPRSRPTLLASLRSAKGRVGFGE